MNESVPPTGPASATRLVPPVQPSDEPFEVLEKLGAPNRLSIGIELPLSNDFAHPGPTFGLPNLEQHHERAVLADTLGFRALWVRDVPLWLPQAFGDAGQIFDPIAYLGYLAAATRHVLLGTAAIVSPLRNPILLAKEAATIDALSGGRLILGLASGDRPSEYPLFGVEYERRAEIYRNNVSVLRDLWGHAASAPNTENKVLPAPVRGRIPLVAVGRGGQTTEWAAEHMDAYMTYHRPGALMRGVVAKWNSSTPSPRKKPVLAPMLLDLAADPDAGVEPIRLGARLGRNALITYLRELERAGVAHIALNLRRGQRPVEDVLTEIADYVLPEFPADGAAE